MNHDVNSDRTHGRLEIDFCSGERISPAQPHFRAGAKVPTEFHRIGFFPFNLYCSGVKALFYLSKSYPFSFQFPKFFPFFFLADLFLSFPKMTQEDDLLPLNWLIHHDVSRDLQPAPRPGKKTLDYILNKAQAVLEKSRANPTVRPPLSYATLILLALHSSPGPLPLSGIYKWIRSTFTFYDTKSGKEALAWMNSIRHNLSLNKCFMRVARGGRGKGGFWKLDPVCEDKLRKGEKFYRLRKRRVKKARVEREETISADGQQCLEVVEMGTPVTHIGTLEPLPEALVPTEFEICQEWTLDWDGERVFELDLVDWNLIL